MDCVIYKIRCLISGKVYIGQTILTVADRFARHVREAKAGRGYALGSAIRKYGKSNFSIEVICQCGSREEASDKEILLIAEYNATHRDKGYNISPGGYQRAKRLNKYDECTIYRARELALTRLHSYIDISVMLNVPAGTIEHMVKGVGTYSKYTSIPPIKERLSTTVTTTGDKISETRLRNRRDGKEHPQSKLNDEQRREIIHLADHGMTRRKIATLFGISHHTVNDIVKYRTRYEL